MPAACARRCAREDAIWTCGGGIFRAFSKSGTAICRPCELRYHANSGDDAKAGSGQSAPRDPTALLARRAATATDAVVARAVEASGRPSVPTPACSISAGMTAPDPLGPREPAAPLGPLRGPDHPRAQANPGTVATGRTGGTSGDTDASDLVHCGNKKAPEPRGLARPRSKHRPVAPEDARARPSLGTTADDVFTRVRTRSSQSS